MTKKTGRPKTMRRLADVEPMIRALIDRAKEARGSVFDVVSVCIDLLIETRTDERLRAARIIFDAFEVPREVRREIARVIYPLAVYERERRNEKRREREARRTVKSPRAKPAVRRPLG